MRSFVSDDALGVLGWPGAQKKCFGLLSDCASAAEVANANSKATTRCNPEIHLSEWARIFLTSLVVMKTPGCRPPPTLRLYSRIFLYYARSKSLGTRNSTQVPGCANPALLGRENLVVLLANVNAYGAEN